MPRPAAVIGVDVGGTKIKAAAVALPQRLIASQQIPTPRLDPAAFYDALAGLVRAVQEESARGGWEVAPSVAVAHPGRFLPDGRLAHGTTPNLGTAPNQFDGWHPAQELARRLAVRVVAENDAVAQMRFALAALLEGPAIRPTLVGETVVYLGPGTGMGGGVARVDRAGRVTPVTDGHFFDMQVPGVADGTLTAEELFTGPAIARLMAPEVVDQALRTPQRNDDQYATAQQIAEQCGAVLAAIIRAIHAGVVAKVRLEQTAAGLVRHVDEPDRAWSAEDCAIVRGCRWFVLGGSVGCSRGLGAALRRQALALLRQQGLGDVVIAQSPVTSADAGVLGVVMALAGAG